MSDLLLDTHAVLWFLWDDSRLSSAAKEAIEHAENRKLVSIASCWEIAIKAGLKKLQLEHQAVHFSCRSFPGTTSNCWLSRSTMQRWSKASSLIIETHSIVCWLLKLPINGFRS
jgi:PIN domain nuclease of toxin-antitoxin system